MSDKWNEMESFDKVELNIIIVYWGKNQWDILWI